MPKTRFHLPLLGAILLLLSAFAAPAALASQLPPGVHVDPGSPAAKEYSIPLSTARGAPPGSSNSGSLFGAGITKSGSGSDRSHTQSPATATHSSPTTSPTGAATTDAVTPAPAQTAASPVTPAPSATSSAAPPPTTVNPGGPMRTAGHPSGGATKGAAAGHHHATKHRHGTTGGVPTQPITRPATPVQTPAPIPSAAKALHPGSGSGLLWMVLVALAVIGLGLGAGVGLTRLRRPGPTFN